MEVAHVSHLIDVVECDIQLLANYEGQTTMRSLDAQDRRWFSGASIRGVRYPNVLNEPPEHKFTPAPLGRLRWNAARRLLCDAYVMVDWSGGSVPVNGENSIWLARAEWIAEEFRIASTNPATRETAPESAALHLIPCSFMSPAFASIATRFTTNRRARCAGQSRSATSADGFPRPSDGHARDRSSRPLQRTPIANCSPLIPPGPVSRDGCGAVYSA